MRMSPKDFWSLTPGEWRTLMVALTPAAGAMTRGDVEKLSDLYPDDRPHKAFLHPEEGRSPVTKDEGTSTAAFVLRDDAAPVGATSPQDEGGGKKGETP